MEHITDLIEDALRRIRIGEPEAAVWRLADAVGQLSERLKEKHPDLLGANMPTGLGFRVVKGPGSVTRVRIVDERDDHDDAAEEAEAPAR